MNPHDATEQAFNNGKIKGAREFAERLKAKLFEPIETWLTSDIVTEENIDETLKEMESEKK